jgi:hypothetical protein
MCVATPEKFSTGPDADGPITSRSAEGTQWPNLHSHLATKDLQARSVEQTLFSRTRFFVESSQTTKNASRWTPERTEGGQSEGKVVPTAPYHNPLHVIARRPMTRHLRARLRAPRCAAVSAPTTSQAHSKAPVSQVWSGARAVQRGWRAHPGSWQLAPGNPTPAPPCPTPAPVPLQLRLAQRRPFLVIWK